LQEVWLKNDQKQIKEKLKNTYPYTFSFETEAIKTPQTPSCQLNNLIGKGKFINCITENCLFRNNNGLTSCILKNCSQSLETLKKENKYCEQALMAQVTNPPPVAFWNILNPISPADLFTYESGTGVMILSKYPFLKKRVIDLTENSTITRRAVLVVDIQPKEFPTPVSIYCTHLTANFENSIPYSGKYKSWQDENKTQIQLVLNSIKTNLNPSVFLGDFNCSVSNIKAGIDDDWNENCQLLASEMKEIHLQNPKCSFCKTNSLTDNETKNLLLDHIYVTGLDYKPAEMLLNGPYPITLIDQKIELKPLSDHYAIETVINPLKFKMQAKLNSKSEIKQQ
jgi:endonuclease/exonuclease/phosphatase family metal-dependent hydrolase